jgi:hypothetical protein
MRSPPASHRSKTFVCFEIYRNSAKILKAPVSSRDMPPIPLAVFHCSLFIGSISVTLDELADGNINGVKIVHLADFLLSKEY